MEHTTTEFQLTSLQKAVAEKVLQTVNIVILDPEKTPPHLILSIGPSFYSLEVKGKTTAGKTNGLFQFLKRTGKKAVFVELKFPELDLETLNRNMQAFHAKYDKVDEHTTCLAPIRTFCMEHFGASLSKANFIFELLKMLEEKGKIASVAEINLNQTALQLPVYTMETVVAHIQSQNPISE